MTVHNHNASHRRTEAQQAALKAARAIRQEQMRERAASIAEDIEWVKLAGESDPDVIASRVGYANKTSLARLLLRHGYKDLARGFYYKPRTRRKAPSPVNASEPVTKIVIVSQQAWAA